MLSIFKKKKNKDNQAYRHNLFFLNGILNHQLIFYSFNYFFEFFQIKLLG
jgi:hypothetical protein